MNLSITEVFDVVVSAAWRRRQLIVIPILIFSVLGAIAAFAWPRTYATRALMMLQERQVSDPLSSGGAVSREGRLRADEIDMLLKSERVLSSAILDINAGKKPLTARDLEGEIRGLRRQISVSVVGSDFIEIELKQSDRVDLGERLSIILTRFFERLLSREDSMKTARQFALKQRKRDLDAAMAALDDWVKRATAAGATTGAGQAKVIELQAKFAAIEQKLMATANAVLPEQVAASNLAEALADELRSASGRVRGSPNQQQASPQYVGALRDLEVQLDAYQTVSTELAKALMARARGMSQTLQVAQSTPSAAALALHQEWQSLDARYADTLTQYDAHQKRSKKASGPTLAPFGLIAPDSIRLIDEPRDPALPNTSPLKIIIVCLMAGVGLGIGLAAVAEQLDDRVYEPRDLNHLAGVDRIFRISKISPENIPHDDLVDKPPRSRIHLAVVGEA